MLIIYQTLPKHFIYNNSFDLTKTVRRIVIFVILQINKARYRELRTLLMVSDTVTDTAKIQKVNLTLEPLFF